MRLLYSAFLFVAIGLVSCNNNNTNTGSEKDNKAQVVNTQAPQSKLNEAGTQKLVALISDYYSLKDAFVATKAAVADSAGARLINSADSLAAFLKTDSANAPLLKPYLDTISTEAKNLVALKDESCEKKRLPFSKISDMMFVLLKNAGMKNAGIYQEYCPMAFDSKGANWLSNDPDIKNPYFGKKMLECGEVTDSLK